MTFSGSPGFAGLPGGGPWIISDYCSAQSHNTLNAARRRRRPGGGCTCPHAMDVLNAWTTRNRERRVEVLEPKSSGPRLRQIVSKPISARSYPDFTGGACLTPDGQKIALAGMNAESSIKGIKDRAGAKALCDTCPIRDSICRPWVLAQERPRGSWGGVWGGLDPWNRMHLQLIWNNELGIAETVPYAIR